MTTRYDRGPRLLAKVAGPGSVQYPLELSLLEGAGTTGDPYVLAQAPRVFAATLLDNPDEDALRAHYSAGAVPGVYVVDSDPDWGDLRAFEAQAAGRLWLHSRTVPARVRAGDALEVMFSGKYLAGATGELRAVVEWHLSDGTTSEAVAWVVDTDETLFDDLGNPYPAPAGAWLAGAGQPVVAPAGAVGAALALESTGAGWRATYVDARNQANAPTDLGTITIRRGRSSAGAAPAPATCTTTLPVEGSIPVQAGQRLRLSIPIEGLFDPPAAPEDPDPAGDSALRFYGDVGEPELSVQRGGAHQLQIIATSSLSKLAGVQIGVPPWPQQSAGERAQAILSAAASEGAAIWWAPDPIPAGGPQVIGRDVDNQAVAGLLDELIESTRGQLLEARDGLLSWRNAQDAYPDQPQLPGEPASPAHFYLTPEHYPTPLRLEQDRAANIVRVYYGTTDPQPYVEAKDDPQAIATVGQRPATVRTQLATAADALDLAHQLLAEGSRPAWRIRNLRVDLLDLLRRWQRYGDPVCRWIAQRLVLMQPGHVVQLRDLPDVTPDLPGSGLFGVEGWTETIAPNAWRFDLQLVDLTQLAEPISYDELPAGWAYADLPPRMRYLDLGAWRP